MPLTVFTPRTKKTNLYADFRKDLAISPLSGDITLLKDEDAVKDALKNLLLTDRGERLMQPDLGGGIKELLFENMTPAVLTLIKDRVEECVKTTEPRAELVSVQVSSNIDDNFVGVKIVFYVRNVEQPITLDVILERTR
jgi:phage baseplate assembly protein W